MEDQQSFRGNDNPLGYLYVEKSILSEFERIFLCQRYSYTTGKSSKINYIHFERTANDIYEFRIALCQWKRYWRAGFKATNVFLASSLLASVSSLISV